MNNKFYIIVISILLLLVLIQAFGLALLAYDRVIDEQILRHIETPQSSQSIHHQPTKLNEDEYKDERDDKAKRPKGKMEIIVKHEDSSCPGRVFRRPGAYPDGFKPFAGKGRKLL